MKKRILSLLLAFLMLFSMFPAYSTYAVETEKEVSVWYFNSVSEAMEEADAVELYRGGELYLSAILRDDISGEIQWQIEANQDFWVDIQGGTAEDLRISYGMVQSLLGNDSVRMRCAVLGDKEYYSDPFTVVVTDVDNRLVTDTFNIERAQAAPDPLPAPVGIPNTSQETEPAATEETEPVATEKTEPVVTEETLEIQNEIVPLASSSTARIMLLSSVTPAEEPAADSLPDENTTIYTVTIEYVYADGYKFAGQRVALPYVYEATAGQTINQTVTSPNCIGYSPDTPSINLANQGAINGNINLTVKYAPAQVSYTVRHYLQNVDNDEYTWVDTTLATGYTEALTSDNAAKKYTGFTALSHYHEEIAADSSTMIDIYYDRNYYLMSFNLDGGYGVEAVYARFGADISVSDPQRAGYSFNGWSLDGTAETSLPSTMPAGNSSYTALWTAGNTSYTVAYWLENADTDGKYDFVGSVSVPANSGDSVSGSNSAVEKGVFTSDERKYYAYNGDKTDVDVTVAGDGSTVVNVYYDRNEYTLKFYYAQYNNGYNVATGTEGSSSQGGTVENATWKGNYDTKPTLDSTYMDMSETINGTTYYYFTLTAKYGADLSTVWPNAPLSNVADDVKFVSWGTQNGSGYHTANQGNPNIKGVYSVMDSGLLIDPSVTADQGVNHWMVGYWGNPTMYTYEIYFSLLDGETSDYTYNSVAYKKVAEYTVGSTAKPSEGQTALSFEGVTNVGMNYDKDERKDGTVIRFFYQRSVHTVTLDDNYGNKTPYTIPYGGTISSYITTVPTPNYPADLPVGAYEFGGWYQSKEGIGVLDTRITMPNEDLIYYALWTPKVYTVTINDGNGTVFTEQVNYGSKATKPTDPTMENATFIGWYYKDADKSEQRFDFDNMTITQDMTIYAKWRSEVMKQVEIYYVVEDEDGNKTQIADTETLMLRLGQTRTFEAKTGNSLYTEYRAGCFPTTASHSITIEDSHIDSTEPVTFTFEYKKYGAVPYQVEFYVQEADGTVRPAFKVTNGAAEFVDTDTYAGWTDAEKQAFAASNTSVSNGGELAEDGQYIEQHWQNDKAVVTELYVPDDMAVSTWTLPDKYLPNALKIQEIIVPSETNPETNITANTIKFVYTYTEPVVDPDNPDNPDPGNPVYEARYLVQHFIQNSSDTTKYDLYSYSDEEGLSGDTAIASPISIPGYTYSHSVTDSNKGNNTLNGDVLSGTISAKDDLELNFYYTVNSYPYQVMYLEEGTNRVLADAKTEVDGNQLISLYGSKVTEEAISIDGYDVVGSSSKSIYIQMEAGNTASVNTIVFYYVKKNADLIITKTVEIDAAQAELEQITDENKNAVANQSFVFTVTAKDGFLSSVYNYTIYAADGTVLKTDKITTKDTYTLNPISIIGGQKIQIHDLPMGEYTVTEAHVVGFRTTVDGTITPSAMVKLETAEQDVTVDFVNTFPFYTGDLVIMKVVRDGSNVVTPANTNYKVKITLNPAAETRELERVITWTNGDGKACTFTVPTLTDNAATSFEIIVDVPAGGEVKMEGVPAGSFTVDEVTNGSTGTITDYYSVSRKVAVHQSDETQYEDGASITSEIHGGHPTAVTFRNTYKNGSLIINKTVTQEYENDNWQSDTFTFTITGTTELPDGTYTVDNATVTVSGGVVTVKDADGNDPTISITKTEGITAWSGSLTYEDLPAGYYTVTESSSTGGLEQYTVTNPAGEQLVNDSTKATEFDFTNTYKRTTGSLQVGKKIVIVTEGSIVDTKQEFAFVVEPKDCVMTGPYPCKVMTTNNTADTFDDTVVAESAASLPVENGSITFTLSHNQYILIEGLPVGDYLVKELAVEGYDSSFGDVTTSAGNYSVDPATITTNSTTILNCQNAYPVYYSNLIVKKAVVTPADHSAIDQAPADDVFTFTVKISDYSSKINLDGGISAKFYDSADDTTPEEKTLTVTNDVLTFPLKHGQWVDLNLPACTYTITETSLDSTVNSDVLGDHYDTTYSVGDTVGSAGASYTLISGEKETVTFTNTYKRHYADLTIKTTCADNTQSFLFDVSATGTALGDIRLTVVLVGNDSQTIKDLPVGDYTVTEQTEWSWREADVTSQTVELRTKIVTVPFDFGVIDRIYWLNGYSYDIRKKGDD